MRLIDADELKEWIEAWFDMNKYYHPYSKRETIPTVELFDILDRIPTIAPVKRGRWVKTGQSFLFPERFMNYSCSVCGYDIDKTKYRYCPHCGALMDEVEE